MPEEALQAAFEIKTACDEISRRLLRWHWEHKPGSNSLGALLDHIAQRQQESPDYYDRMPDLSGKSSWQQLDTTICMRVLLDPEKDAEKPLDLLGNTSSPGAARRACNTVRTARNEAAHATDQTDAAQAAILFNERSCSTKPSNVWRMPTQARPSGKTSWPAITVRQRSFCSAAGQRSLLHPAVHRLKKSLPPAVHPARAQGRTSAEVPRTAKRAAAALPARERQHTAIPAATALQRAVEIQIVKRNGKIPAIRQS